MQSFRQHHLVNTKLSAGPKTRKGEYLVLGRGCPKRDVHEIRIDKNTQEAYNINVIGV